MTMLNDDPIVIVGAKRTPMGGFLSNFKDVSAVELGAVAIQGALKQADIKPNQVSEVLMGCVLPAGLGQAPARQAALKAGIPDSVGAVTVNKVCGSGMRTVMMASDMLMAGSAEIVVAGGMESMSRAPYLLDKAREGYRMGHKKVYDHMISDGLQDAYKGCMMGDFAEETAADFKLTRQDQDAFATASAERARDAQAKGLFKAEIEAVEVKTKKGSQMILQDELPDVEKTAKIPMLKPAFKENGTITAANASSINDGAAALVLMRRSMAEKLGCPILATLCGHQTHSQKPEQFNTAPVGAIEKLAKKINWNLKDVDLFEINEAFAVTALCTMKELNLPHSKVNVYGGACALGHPIGASGSRILVTLLNAMHTRKLSTGIASLCIGGGEATAVAIKVNHTA